MATVNRAATTNSRSPSAEARREAVHRRHGCRSAQCDENCRRYVINNSCNGQCGEIDRFTTNLSKVDFDKFRYCGRNGTMTCNCTSTSPSSTSTSTTISITISPRDEEKKEKKKGDDDGKVDSSYYTAAALGALGASVPFVIAAAIVLTMRHRKKKRMVLLTKKTKEPIVAIKSAVATADVSIGPATAGADVGDVSMGRGAAKTNKAAAEQQIAEKSTSGEAMKPEYDAVGRKESGNTFGGVSTLHGDHETSKIAANSPDVSGSKLSKSKMGKSTVDAASSSKKPPPAAQSIKSSSTKKESSTKKK